MSYTKSFIETQFPVSKISKESYSERKDVQSQTLTGLGKWWGRKPLILVRATILGLLIPSSNDPQKDREVFLKILSMDDEGLWQRKERDLTISQYYHLSDTIQKAKYFTFEEYENKKSAIKWIKDLSDQEKENFQKEIFNSLSYDERLTICCRPEQLANLTPLDWDIINKHLQTTASNLKDLIEQLGQKQFGHKPKVGDAFCGGGSIPFEAANIGCDAFGSDLNPVAALLTWASLNIIGAGEDVIEEVKKSQLAVYNSVDKQICDWGIEHNELGWRADAFLYCIEAHCSVTGYLIPLLPTFLVGESSKVITRLIRNEEEKRYNIEVISNPSKVEFENAKINGTIKSGYIINPDTNDKTSIAILRGDRKIKGASFFGLRMWDNEDVEPRADDVFQERLYCIRYFETYYEKHITEDKIKTWLEITKQEAEAYSDFQLQLEKGTIRKKIRKHFVAPNEKDLQRETKVVELLKERFNIWQKEGYIPSKIIERGEKTDEPIRTRGWTHWHHLFTPRQLLYNGLFSYHSLETDLSKTSKVACLTGVGRITDWNSKLCRWGVGAARESIAQTYFNQALNTLYNYAGKSLRLLKGNWMINPSSISKVANQTPVVLQDAREIKETNDLWITDPPYGDAIHYHELNDFFIAWYNPITKIFPDWYFEGKKALAIKGNDEDFRKGMVQIYTNLQKHMPANGAQVVMFTHQNTSVWADLALILWSSGLQVTSAWTIATETNSALKAGNYVQGTVCMVLRKQTSDEETFINDVYPEIEQEVIDQLKSMTDLDDKEDPNFSDSDYQLAAYAAALRVLTKYKKIHPIDVEYELTKPRKKGEKNEVEKLIDKAVVIATNYLIPEGLEKELWITLGAEEKFYLKGLEVETHGEYRNGVYQEFARGFGVKEYKHLLSTGSANETRLRSAIELKNKTLSDDGFGTSALRQILFAIHETHVQEDPKAGRQFLKDEIKEYWQNRQKLIVITRYIQNLGSRIGHWQNDAKAANLLAGSLENDHI